MLRRLRSLALAAALVAPATAAVATVVDTSTASAAAPAVHVVASRRPPRGAMAQCRDGSYSYSRSHRGTCSWHGGVRRWFR